MKLFFVSILLVISLVFSAQTPLIPRELSNLLRVPYLETNNRAAIEESPGGIFSFDKFVAIKSKTTKGETIDIFLYINTRTGAFATITERENVLETENFDTNSKNFKLFYYSPKGKIIQFYTRLQKGELKKYFATMNTEVVAYTPSIPLQNTWLFKQGAEFNTLPQNFHAAHYKATTDNAPTMVLCGYPIIGKLLASNFIGYSGIGYVKTDKGVYMITEIKPAYSGVPFTATKWKEINLQLNIADFTSAEAEFYSKTGESIEKKLNKPVKIKDGPCASLVHEKEMEKKRVLLNQKDLLGKTSRGNMVNDKSVQNALASMQDPTTQLELSRLETEIKLCNIIDRMNSQSTTELDKQKRDCLETRLGDIANAKAESDAIDAKFGLDKVKALPEKIKIMKKLGHQTSQQCMKVL